MRTLRFGALTVLLSLISLTGAASADDGLAALLPFQGPQAAKVRQNVQKGLRAADVQLVSLKQVTAVVKKTKGYAKQAARLKASVLVRSRVRRVEGRWIADTEVRNAKGQRVEKLRITSSSIARLSNRIVAQLMKTGRMPGAVAAVATKAEPEPPPAPTQPRLVIRPFTGVQAGKIRGAAVRGLRPEPVELFPNGQFVEEARSLGVDLKAAGGHVAPASALAVSALYWVKAPAPRGRLPSPSPSLLLLSGSSRPGVPTDLQSFICISSRMSSACRWSSSYSQPLGTARLPRLKIRRP